MCRAFTHTHGQRAVDASTRTAATHTIAGGSGIGEYCSISYSIVTPTANWYAYNSVDGGNNTGWNFRTLGAAAEYSNVWVE